MPLGSFRLNGLSKKLGELVSYWFNEVTDTATTDTQIFNSVVDSSGNVYASGNGYGSERGIMFKWNKDGVLQWKKVITANYAIRTCAIDSSGNLYIVGANETASPSRALIIKVNSSGSIVWQRNVIHDTSYSAGNWCIKIDSSDNIYCAGRYNQNDTDWRLHLEKFDTSGNIVFSRKYSLPQTGYFYLYDMSVDPSGNIWFGGYYATSSNYNFVLKVSSDGTVVGAKTMTVSNNSNQNLTTGIKTDQSGNAYVFGYHYDSAAPGGYFRVIYKLDSSLNLVWERRLETASFYGESAACDIDSSNNFYIAFRTSSTSQSKIVIAKYNDSGTLQWARDIDGPNAQQSWGLTVSGNYFLISGATSSVSSSDENVLLWKLPTDGSKTGTYTNSLATYTYSVNSITDSAHNKAVSSVTFTKTNASFTTTTPSAGFTDISGTSYTVSIP